jgi:hypothetical protein
VKSVRDALDDHKRFDEHVMLQGGSVPKNRGLSEPRGKGLETEVPSYLARALSFAQVPPPRGSGRSLPSQVDHGGVIFKPTLNARVLGFRAKLVRRRDNRPVVSRANV